MDLSEFLNCTVGVTESQHTIDIMGVPETFTDYEVVEGDPIIAAIRTRVETAGFHLRVWFPNTVGTMELHTGRVNVGIDEVLEGHFEITEIWVG
jgi:hypothetical protein